MSANESVDWSGIAFTSSVVILTPSCVGDQPSEGSLEEHLYCFDAAIGLDRGRPVSLAL
jgi:hypothetical protein